MTDKEKIAELIRTVENVDFILQGERTEEAIKNLAAYIDRKLREIKDWP